MSPQEIGWMRQDNADLRKQVEKLQGDIAVKDAKEKELRALISYLNKMGPKPENMTP